MEIDSAIEDAIQELAFQQRTGTVDNIHQVIAQKSQRRTKQAIQNYLLACEKGEVKDRQSYRYPR